MKKCPADGAPDLLAALKRSLATPTPPLYVLSLWQPWATLHALPNPETGIAFKQNETRHFRPRHPLPFTAVIHAAKKWDRATRELLGEWPFYESMQRLGFRDPTGFGCDGLTLPFGALIGTVEYHEVRTSEEVTAEHKAIYDEAMAAGRHDVWVVERGLGNYEPGRFAWVSRNPRPFKTPIPFKGRQDVLYPLPAEYRALVEEQLAQ